MEHTHQCRDPDGEQATREDQGQAGAQVFTTPAQAPRSQAWSQEQSLPVRTRERSHVHETLVSPLTSVPPPNVRPFRQFQQQIAQPVHHPHPRKPAEPPTDVLSPLEHNQTMAQVNYALLYPQMDSYYMRDYRPTKDDHERALRAVSQPNTPSFRAQRGRVEEPEEVLLRGTSRLSICTPAQTRRPRSAMHTTEAPFTDAEEFHLFVQATAGLGPDIPLRSETSMPSLDDERRRHTMHARAGPPHIVSPIQQTPTTIRALQHMAQMPEQVFTLPRRPAEQRSVAQPIHASDGGMNLWAESGRENAGAGDVSPIEDELPGYAESQAQAQASQAAQARKRAQELARRWHEAHG